MKQTPLYGRHKALGAKVIDFGGWAMPVQYSGILDEHKAVREAVGLFDVSHMGEVVFRGPRARRGGAAAGHQRRRQARRRPGDVHLRLPADGRHRRRLHRLPRARRRLPHRRQRLQHRQGLRLVPRARRRPVRRRRRLRRDRAARGAGAARRRAGAVARRRAGRRATSRSTSRRATVAGVRAHVARTGYTGEDGFELFVAADDAGALWDALLEAGGRCGLKPIGLGARDTLRLEARLSLYGNDIDEEHTPLEAGLAGWSRARDFIGEEALAQAEGRGRHPQARRLRHEGARHRAPRLSDRRRRGPRDRRGHLAAPVGPTVGADIGLGYVPVAPGGRGHAPRASTAAASAPRPRWSRARSTSVARKGERNMSTDYPERPPLHQGARVGARRRQRRHRRHHPVRRRAARRHHPGRPAQGGRGRSSRDAVFGTVESVKAVSRPVRAGAPARWSRSTTRSATRPSTSTRTATTRAGWCRSRSSDPKELDALMNAEQYQAYLKEQESH